MKRQKYCSTANRVLCMAVRIQGQDRCLDFFKLMRPEWIRATPLRNAGKGKRLLV